MVSSVASCSICKDPLEEGQGVQLNCQHEFHRSCIDTWIDVCRRDSRAPSCPLDRGRITAINGELLENSEVSAGSLDDGNPLTNPEAPLRRRTMIQGPSLNQRIEEIFNGISRNTAIRNLDIAPIRNLDIAPIRNLDLNQSLNQRVEEAFNRLERHNQSLNQRIEETFNRLEIAHNQRMQQMFNEFRSSFTPIRNLDLNQSLNQRIEEAFNRLEMDFNQMQIFEAFNRLERHNQSLSQRIEIFNGIPLDITPIRRLEMDHNQMLQQISDEFRSSSVINVNDRVQEMQGQADSSSEEAGILSPPEPQRNNVASPSTLRRIAQIATDLISMAHERITEWRNRYLADPVP